MASLKEGRGGRCGEAVGGRAVKRSRGGKGETEGRRQR
jgi:hypothetical protein